MESIVISIIAANLAATGCSLLLARRGPTRRLKLLTMTVGLMSLSQTAAYLHAQGIWSGGHLYVAGAHQSLVACLSLFAMYLLGKEIYDRSLTDRKLRLTEHEILQPAAETVVSKPAERVDAQPSKKITVKGGEMPERPVSTAVGLMQLLERSTEEATRGGGAWGPQRLSEAVRESSGSGCEGCRAIAAEMARSWLEVHLCMEANSGPTERLQLAKDNLVRAIRNRWEHELKERHELLDHPLLTDENPEAESCAMEANGGAAS